MKKGILIAASIIGLVGLVVFVSKPKTLEERATSSAPDQEAQLIAPANNGDTDTQTNSPLVQRPSLEVADFKAQLISGESVQLSDLVFDKPTIVGFWATWCHNCQRNMPKMSELYKDYKDEINLLKVNMGERRSSVDSYLADKGYSFDIAYDESGVISQVFGIQYTNTHFLLGTDGKIIDAFSGDVSQSHFEKMLKEI